MIFEQVKPLVLFVVSILVVLEARGVSGAMAGVVTNGAELMALRGFGDATRH